MFGQQQAPKPVESKSAPAKTVAKVAESQASVEPRAPPKLEVKPPAAEEQSFGFFDFLKSDSNIPVPRSPSPPPTVARAFSKAEPAVTKPEPVAAKAEPAKIAEAEPKRVEKKTEAPVKSSGLFGFFSPVPAKPSQPVPASKAPEPEVITPAVASKPVVKVTTPERKDDVVVAKASSSKPTAPAEQSFGFFDFLKSDSNIPVPRSPSPPPTVARAFSKAEPAITKPEPVAAKAEPAKIAEAEPKRVEKKTGTPVKSSGLFGFFSQAPAKPSQPAPASKAPEPEIITPAVASKPAAKIVTQEKKDDIAVAKAAKPTAPTKSAGLFGLFFQAPAPAKPSKGSESEVIAPAEAKKPAITAAPKATVPPKQPAKAEVVKSAPPVTPTVEPKVQPGKASGGLFGLFGSSSPQSTPEKPAPKATPVKAAPIAKSAPVVASKPVATVKSAPAVKPISTLKASLAAKPAPSIKPAPVVKSSPVLKSAPVVKAVAPAKPSPAVKAPPAPEEKKSTSSGGLFGLFGSAPKKSEPVAVTAAAVKAAPAKPEPRVVPQQKPSGGLFGSTSKPKEAAVPAAAAKVAPAKVQPTKPASAKAAPVTPAKASPKESPKPSAPSKPSGGLFGFFGSSSSASSSKTESTVSKPTPETKPLSPQKPSISSKPSATATAAKAAPKPSPSAAPKAAPTAMNPKFINLVSKKLANNTGKIKSFQQGTNDFRCGIISASEYYKSLVSIFGEEEIASIVEPLILELPEKDLANNLKNEYKKATTKTEGSSFFGFFGGPKKAAPAKEAPKPPAKK